MKTIGFLVTEKDIEGYAGVSGDYNPIHFELKDAQQHGFPDRIAHGMLTMGKVWSVLSWNILSPTDHPIKYDIKFLAPVFVGDVVTLNVTNTENSTITIEGNCAGKPVITGTVVLKNCSVKEHC
ncbi:MaoC family dehydratase [Neobacillus sp. LXY-4]|uniref:MaoC family dehydratase n=1 Tax=Neobacillus sp. LXY-4 TaxID=3379826 RepID=UPI003EE28443